LFLPPSFRLPSLAFRPYSRDHLLIITNSCSGLPDFFISIILDFK
jgi:hypothetical protein